MDNAVILLGTNRGILAENLLAALQHIEKKCGRIIKKSSVYRTEPWGLLEQPYFLNQVIEITTKLSARKLLEELLDIEGHMGRKRSVKWAPRLIDLDILFYNDAIINANGLTIPHPHLHERRFTLEPLCEILPGKMHPVLAKPMRELLSSLPDNSKVSLSNPDADSNH